MPALLLKQRRKSLVPSTSVFAEWSRGDRTRTLAWMVMGILVRAPLVARIEGVLEHDQSVVGLMAMDIAAGRRWPLFFDGQRYMGALEAYTSAVFVTLFGPAPSIVALAPLFYFGLFAAGQYALWRCWSGRATGHLAALITVLAAPMPTLWSIVARGGYIEILAWALPILGFYRVLTRPDRGPPSHGAQFAWGALLAFGYFLNPLSLIVYLTLAIDWTLGRHGTELRGARRLGGGWPETRRAPWYWAGIGGMGVLTIGASCHVDFDSTGPGAPFVYALDALPEPWGKLAGSGGVAVILAGAAWWTGAGRRLVQRLSSHPWFTAGATLALAPSLVYNLLVLRGIAPWAPSLPIWIRAPWKIGANAHFGIKALGPLIGCDPDAATSVLGPEVGIPAHSWPGLSRLLEWTSPASIAIVLGLLALVAWKDRAAWRRFWSLRTREPTPPTVLGIIGLAVATTLYILQATSLSASSSRYLVMAWVFLPGLLAHALRALPVSARLTTAVLLMAPWVAAQANLWADMGRPSPQRPLTRELERRGVRAVVAQPVVAQIVTFLSGGRVGALEYHPIWPRLRDRYAGRFVPGRPVTCVVDRRFPWASAGDKGWPECQDLGRDLRELARERPDRVRLVARVDPYEIWEVDLSISEILGTGTSALPREG